MQKIQDTSPRWAPGERLDHLFERKCDELDARALRNHPAVIERGISYSYRDIDVQANRLARHLRACGVRSGDRVGLLFSRSKETYVALLATMKVNAAYVPLDAGFPDERIQFILNDAEVQAILSFKSYADRLSPFSQPKVFLDSDLEGISSLPGERLDDRERGAPVDDLSYIIYTSGTTGNPKGVAIEHSSICNFVRVAAETYGVRSDDRVYQGMTIAFDFSVEELWVPLMAGATLVPAPPVGNLVGEDLAGFLQDQQISVLCCVPTLLATIERDLPDLRLLLVSGEACPQNLVSRWYGPGRTILNAYGPTEATVTATLTELYPEKPVTIGVPLPSYSVVILEEDDDKLVADGETGEIGIAGIGLARGYVNRDDLTAQKFICDFVGLPDNPSKRIYRTGDLGRFNTDGEIEYFGRLDTQVKIRGYRIELTEIESVMLKIPGIAQAVVNTYEPEPGTVELVGYYSLQSGACALSAAEIVQTLRRQVPPYMVPAYIEELPLIPMTSSHKADRKRLPPPQGPRHAVAGGDYVAPKNEQEQLLEAELASILNMPRISITDDFFTDLGAHSLLMARFCAAIRANAKLPNASMQDIYLNPTIESLSASLKAPAADAAVERQPAPRHVPTDLQYYGCAALQLASGIALGVIAYWTLVTGFHWTYAAIDDKPELYLRIVAYMSAVFVAWSAIPVAAKWLLIGRWKAETLPVWSLRYFRFWLVKSLVQISPMMLFIGGPAYNLYLRLLGAKIGAGTSIRSSAPICTDLFTVGENTLVRDGTLMPGYHAEGNLIHIGPIRIGSDAFVGTASVVEIDTTVGDGSQLGHASCLERGQSVPDGKHYHGTPAQETQADYCPVEPLRCTELRRWIYTATLFLKTMLVWAPLPTLIIYHLYPYVYRLTGADQVDYSAPLSVLITLAPPVIALSLILYFGFMLLWLLLIYAVPRLLNSFLREDKTYVLFGIHYFLQNLISGFSNSDTFNVLFGDSAFIVKYLKLVGYNLNEVKQTGANFGLDQMHDNPFLCEVGSGAMASDELAMANAEMSSSSFRLRRTEIGKNSFLGNNILFPAGARVGSNVLLATKVMVPIDGPVRENVGLLGSPCFEIPRVVERDQEISNIDPAAQADLLQKKTRFNLQSIIGYLLSNWLIFYISLQLFYMAILYYPQEGAITLIAFGFFMWFFGTAYWILVERASLKFGGLQARIVSMYDDYFLFHERHWKFCAHPLVQVYAGTPFKNLISWLLGADIGRKVFDDGADLYDKTLLKIGDHANLNLGSILQAHSLEEGVFKSDHVRIGEGCCLRTGAFVHYGVDMGDKVTLGANAFLMKGEILQPGTVWYGNPARTDAVEQAAGADPTE